MYLGLLWLSRPLKAQQLTNEQAKMEVPGLCLLSKAGPEAGMRNLQVICV